MIDMEDFYCGKYVFLNEFCKIEVRHTFGKKKICFIVFFFLKKIRNFLLDNTLSCNNQLFLESPERRFSKIIYA
jgi:hypothetical protein